MVIMAQVNGNGTHLDNQHGQVQLKKLSLCQRFRKFKIRNPLFREMLAEGSGLFILLVFGFGCSAQFVLSRGTASDLASLYIGWGVAVSMGVYWAWGVSGSHLNPGITLGVTSLGIFPLYKAPLYILAQNIGAFLAAAVVYGTYYDAINEFDGGVRQVIGENATAAIFVTFPRSFVSTTNCFFDQVVGTALLMSGALVLLDKRNSDLAVGLPAFMIGLIVMAISAGYGWNCMGAINPARDFGPRLFLSIAGWGVEVFSYRDFWFWVPIMGPSVGGIVGAQFYDFMIRRHHPDPTEGLDEDSFEIMEDQEMKAMLHNSS